LTFIVTFFIFVTYLILNESKTLKILEKEMKKLINISNLISLISCTNGSGFGTFNSRRGTDTGSGIVDIDLT